MISKEHHQPVSIYRGGNVVPSGGDGASPFPIGGHVLRQSSR